jgi:hypothetical protein
MKYYLGDKIMEDEVGKVCGTCEERRNAHRVLVENPEGKRPLGRCRHNSKTYLKEQDKREWTQFYLAQDRDKW